MMKSSFFAAIFAGAITFPASSKAAVLLLIDVSNLSAVTFTSTGESASASSSSTQFRDGVVLSGFYKSVPSLSTLFNISGTLTTPGDVPTYTRLAAINVISGSDVDINLYVHGTHPQRTVAQRFNTSSAAFIGGVTIDMTGFENYLIPQGTGNIYAGYSNPVLIGQWQTIPEPALWKTGALFGGCLLIYRKLQKRRSEGQLG